MKEFFELYFIFFKIAVTTFGGGYAMMPVLIRELVDNKSWTTVDKLLDYYAIGQCTPGIIAVNVATFIGYKRKGKLGGIIATLGVITPSVLIMSIAVSLINTGFDVKAVQHAFAGIRIVVIALILNTVIVLWKRGVKGFFGYFIVIFVLLISIIFKVSPVFIVLISAFSGIANAIFLKGGMIK